MREILSILLFLLPLHAFLVTVLKCNYGINVDILRFWKEFIIAGLAIYTFFRAYTSANYSLKNLYHHNTLLGLTTAFIICSALYMYLPFFELKPASVLGFRYDVFFLIAMLVWVYSGLTMSDARILMKNLFLSTFAILIVFLPWYLFGDISALATMFWYSSEVSTYTANSCISFSQNVNGEHRFQATFGGPIRFSVFLVITYTLFCGWLFSSKRFIGNIRYLLLTVFWVLCITAIFFSFSKTSMLGLLFCGVMFSLLGYKYVYQKNITQKFYMILAGVLVIPITLTLILKWEMFLHFWAVINRLDNLKISMEMFFYNPIGYWLGIAGPASQIGTSIESAGNWQIATSTVTTVHRFLPENWFVQILLEQGIIGFSLFMALMILIGVRLVSYVKKHRGFLWVGIATGFFGLLFMSLFTHGFEEAATSYMLFLFIGIMLSESVQQEQRKK